MESQQFKIGDVVQLKSGGPKMTISSTITSPTSTLGRVGDIRCAYFVDNIAKHNIFNPETLELVKE